MAAAQAAENEGDEWGLTWYFCWGIFASIPTWIHSQNSGHTQGIWLWIWNWDNNMIWISQWRGRHCRTKTGVRQKKEIQKRWTVRITAWDTSRKVKHMSKVVWDYKRLKIIRVHQIYQSSTRTGNPVLMMDAKVSKDKNICRSVDLENLIYVRWNRIKNSA